LATNAIHYSALDVLRRSTSVLGGIGFRLSEVKGLVMDRLSRSHLLSNVNGTLFLS